MSINPKKCISYFQLPVRETSAECDCNAYQEGSLHLAPILVDQDIFLKSKTRSRFPNFYPSTLDKCATTHERHFFLGQELLLDFGAWIDLTSNADNLISEYQLPSKF